MFFCEYGIDRNLLLHTCAPGYDEYLHINLRETSTADSTWKILYLYNFLNLYRLFWLSMFQVCMFQCIHNGINFFKLKNSKDSWHVLMPEISLTLFQCNSDHSTVFQKQKEVIYLFSKCLLTWYKSKINKSARTWNASHHRLLSKFHAAGCDNHFLKKIFSLRNTPTTHKIPCIKNFNIKTYLMFTRK